VFGLVRTSLHIATATSGCGSGVVGSLPPHVKSRA